MTSHIHPATVEDILRIRDGKAFQEVQVQVQERVAKQKPSPFVGLHVHSEHSFLDGYSKVEHIAKRAKELGQGAVAITDHGECGGHLLFQKACQKEGVKPIFGMEGYWLWDIQDSRDRKTKGYDNSHITLLAKNQKGLSNLWAWSSKAYEEKFFYGKPQADPGLMKEYGEGLYASDGCLLTEFGRSLEDDNIDRCREIFSFLLNTFGDNFFSELHTFQIVDPITEEHKQLNAQMAKLNQAKVQLSTEMGVPMVVVNDCHYSWPGDWENHELVWAMSTGGTDKMERGEAAAHHMADEEIYFWMARHGISKDVVTQAIEYTSVVAENCNVEIKPTLEMPRLTESEEDDVKLFLDHVEAGFQKKVVDGGHDQDTYLARVEEEVQLIVDKNFCGYFNIVADYTKAAKDGSYGEWIGIGKQPPMLVGPSRGSAGGSLVAYLMDITEIDPIKYNLLFGRFLSPARKGYPDIDLDFPQSKRPHMKEYLATRYGGPDHVCAIGTRSKSKPRGILADLCRAMEISYEDSRKMADIISEVEDIDTTNVDVSWDEVLIDKGGDLEPWVRKYPKLFEKMGEMVGIVRQASTHAAGILVSNKALLGNLPTRVRGGQVSTQFDMYEVEELGAVKFDILGIRHLDTLEVARDLVLERHGVFLDYYAFGDTEFQDPEIWELIDEGKTDGIFQLEAHQMTKIGKQFKPRHERDVADLISVNRPGVIRADLLSPYLKRRHGLEEATFDHPMMEQITGKTHGIIVYQEQVLLTVMQLAHFTVDEAEKVRKNLGKMLYSEMKKMKDDFAQGCLKNPDYMKHYAIDEGKFDTEAAEAAASKIWISIQESGIYVFNEAHAIGYALISSWETYLKKKYFLEDQAALMRTDPPKVIRYIRESRQHHIAILPPDVNESNGYFTLVGDDIRYGLESIKGVGVSAVKDILKNRPFTSFADFLERCSSTGAAKKGVVEKLISIGAFDAFGGRGELLQAYYDFRVLSQLSATKKKKLYRDVAEGEDPVNELDPDKVSEYLSMYYADYYTKERDEKWKDEYIVPDFDDQNVVYEIEKDLVGNFITIDPMLKYTKAICNLCIMDPGEIELAGINDVLTIGGQLKTVKPYKTQKGRNPGQDMAFLTVTWNDMDFEVTVFPEAYESYKNFLHQGAPVILQAIRLERGCHMTHMERLDYVL